MEFLKSKKVKFWETLEKHSISKGSSIDAVVDRIFEWKYLGFDSFSSFSLFLESLGFECINEDVDRCICGTHIKYKYIIYNPLTRCYAFIGSSCKNRFFLRESESQESLLYTALQEAKSKLDFLKNYKIDDQKTLEELKKLAWMSVYYLEKKTKYKKNMIVTKYFDFLLKKYTGRGWPGKIWGKEDDERAI